ncbi:GAF domain-containing protein [Ramlibacter pallidus]|uniref:GAF domain-containing protein n=1 Tax=Ramlibacter pallidus TaxID=2780087 RepID=A0ABR9RZ71_9BURK|nr:GAF domain-containing protein [Ramlibacter pallidus]MBE7366541.1 GAF domain-containing protein [Ramlibacter pallidus]
MHPPPLQEVRHLLATGGLQPALAYLNQRVPHRFTAVYKVEGGVMRNIAIVDKQGEVVPEHLLEVPFASSYCQFVLRDGYFRFHGLRDDRLEGHPYQGIVNSYVGLPLSTDGDQVVGTFCHFDFPAQAIADAEYELMQQVAPDLATYVP